MKKRNVLLIAGLVLLFTCGTALADGLAFGTDSDNWTPPTQGDEVASEGGTATPVPEPTTMLLLGSGLAVLAVGARKKKK